MFLLFLTLTLSTSPYARETVLFWYMMQVYPVQLERDTLSDGQQNTQSFFHMIIPLQQHEGSCKNLMTTATEKTR